MHVCIDFYIFRTHTHTYIHTNTYTRTCTPKFVNLCIMRFNLKYFRYFPSNFRFDLSYSKEKLHHWHLFRLMWIFNLDTAIKRSRTRCTRRRASSEHPFCRRAPLLAMIQPLRALPFNTMKPASIYTPTLLITPNSRSQKHLHVILSR